MNDYFSVFSVVVSDAVSAVPTQSQVLKLSTHRVDGSVEAMTTLDDEVGSLSQRERSHLTIPSYLIQIGLGRDRAPF